jgi:methyl-accepting chemotaxis protein
MLRILRDLPFTLKIATMPFIATVGFVAVLIMHSWTSSRTSAVFTEIRKQEVLSLVALNEAWTAVELLDRRLEEATDARSLDELDAIERDREHVSGHLHQAAAAMPRDQEVAALVPLLDRYYETALPATRRAIESGMHWDRLNATTPELEAHHTELTRAVDQQRERVKQLMDASFAQLQMFDRSAKAGMTLVVLIALAALGAITILVTRYVRDSLRRTMEVAHRLAEGDFTERLETTARDELGTTRQCLDDVFLHFRRVIESTQESAATVSAAAERLADLSSDLGSAAEETAGQAGSASSAAEQVSVSVQTVAAAVEEMTSNIREIAANAAEAAKIAASAVDVARTTNRTVAALGSSSREIGNVIDVITSVAEQTNLLALNATIEAARAGQAGRGFAVVASEVKGLASETARATDEIRTRIAAIQSDSEAAVEAIGTIGSIIERINDIQATIASAVEEQTVTASEISSSIAQAASGTGEIAGNVAAVATAAQQTTQGAGSSSLSATELAAMAEQMQQSISGFRF